MISINIKNTKKLINAVEMYGKEALKEVGEVTKFTAQEIENTAKMLAPVDKSQLKASIKSEMQEDNLHYKITAYQPYSAYQEFGTGGKVVINEDWSEMASQFKGAGIREVNLTPQPFMFPAYVKGRAEYNKSLRDLFKELAKRFNK